MMISSSPRIVAARYCAASSKQKSLALFQNSVLNGFMASHCPNHASSLQPHVAYLHSSADSALTKRTKSSLHLPFEEGSHNDILAKHTGTKDLHDVNYDGNNQEINITPDFSNTKLVYESKSTIDLIRAAITLQLCRIPSLVDHAEDILKLSRKAFGNTITDSVIKATFFKHFCAGEHEEDIRPVVQKLDTDAGIGSVLYYAAESSDDSNGNENSNQNTLDDDRQEEAYYTTEFESQADEHLNSYIDGIENLTKLGSTKDDYAAIKITALGNPILLKRISQTITETKRLFEKFDLNKDGTIGRDEFEQCYR